MCSLMSVTCKKPLRPRLLTMSRLLLLSVCVAVGRSQTRSPSTPSDVPLAAGDAPVDNLGRPNVTEFEPLFVDLGPRVVEEARIYEPVAADTSSLVLDWPPTLKVEDVKETIRNTNVTDILDTYTNKEQKDILFGQLAHCPYTSLCRVNVSESLPDLSTFYSGSCCDDCSCDPSCVETYNCCPDLVKIDTSELPLPDKDDIHRPICIPMYLQSAEDPGEMYGVHAIAKCPVTSNRHIAYQCTREYTVGELSFSDIVPVTHTEGGVIYRNQFCALCNKVNRNEIVYWSVYLQLNSGALTMSSDTEAINQVLSSAEVSLRYSNVSPLPKTDCLLDVISTCNTTGGWPVQNDSIARACQFYSLPYRTGGRYYANVFCAVCNGHDPYLATCPDTLPSFSPGIPSFSVLLKTSPPATEPGTSEAMQCATGYVEDKLKNTCRKLHCLHMMWLSEGQCETLNTISRTLLYIATARLTPITDVSLSQANQIADDVITWIITFQTEMLHSNEKVFFSRLCGAHLLYITDSPTEHPTGDSRLMYYDVRLEMEIDSDADPDDIVKDILNLEDRTINVNNNGYEYTFHLTFIENQPSFHFDIVSNISSTGTFSNDDFSYYPQDTKGLPLMELLDLHNNLTREFSDANNIIPHIREKNQMAKCDVDIQTVQVRHTMLKSCPVLKLSRDWYTWNVTSNGIYLPEIRQYINNAEFIFEIYDTLVVVCADYFLAKVNTFRRESNEITAGSNTEGILTFVSLIVSLICLLLAFVTFCLFRVLRTLPGMNNMALIASLFVAQALFMVGMYGGLDPASTSCKTTGLLIHLFWLLALMWMNVCTFHVFRLFAMTMSSVSMNTDWASLVRYTVYCMGVSCLFVTINVVVSLVTSDGSDMGYGTHICYISSPRMVGYTFGIPVGLVVLSNMCMFVTVIIKIKQAPRVEKNVKNQRNDIVVFAKLSSLTGISWLFGLLFDWTDYTVFSYLFIVFNASQGLFLFLAFVCNQRVFKLYRSRVTGVDPGTRSFRTRSTIETNTTEA